MTEIDLKIDGHDEIKVDVQNGITFEGTILNVQLSGDRFIISGKLKEGK